MNKKIIEVKPITNPVDMMLKLPSVKNKPNKKILIKKFFINFCSVNNIKQIIIKIIK